MKLELARTNDFCGSDNPRLNAVLIHGIASDSSTYNEALDYFRGIEGLSVVRFVTFDLLGAGTSPTSDDLEYNYDEQIEALHNSIHALDTSEPLVLVGHSLGTFIVTKYASLYPDDVAQLILISPPVFTPEDFENPVFMMGLEAFKQAIGARDPQILNSKAFQKSMDNIVLNRDNYATLCGLSTPTTLVYGTGDQLIASFNIPKLLKTCPNISAISTDGRHGVTRDKYTEVAELLEGLLDKGVK